MEVFSLHTIHFCRKRDFYEIIVFSVFGRKKILPAVLESDIQSWHLVDPSTVKRTYFLLQKTMLALHYRLF